jgi:hypothetical protein
MFQDINAVVIPANPEATAIWSAPAIKHVGHFDATVASEKS